MEKCSQGKSGLSKKIPGTGLLKLGLLRIRTVRHDSAAPVLSNLVRTFQEVVVDGFNQLRERWSIFPATILIQTQQSLSAYTFLESTSGS